MDRRTFVKVAAGSPLLAAGVEARQGHGRTKAWPEVVSLDNPIGHPYPVHFVEELPLVVRGYAWTSSLEKETELFRFTAHEWITDAVLFRGMEIKPRNPSDLVNRELQGAKLSLYVDDFKVSDGFKVGDFMAEGGRAFRRWDRDDATKVLYCAMLGWKDKDGWPDPERFLGYFLPNKTCIAVKMENSYKGDISVEIKCDMARYTLPTPRRT
jgi:hypothetical protein